MGLVNVDMADSVTITDDLHRVRGVGDLVELVRDDDRGDALFAAKPVDQVDGVRDADDPQHGQRNGEPSKDDGLLTAEHVRVDTTLMTTRAARR